MVLSKFLYTFIVMASGKKVMVNDFNTKIHNSVCDVHCWIEDEFGKIEDPTPCQWKGEKKYMRWNNQEEALKLIGDESWQMNCAVNYYEYDSPENRAEFIEIAYEQNAYHQEFGCYMNSIIKATMENKIVVCGSMGVMKDNENIII